MLVHWVLPDFWVHSTHPVFCKVVTSPTPAPSAKTCFFSNNYSYFVFWSIFPRAQVTAVCVPSHRLCGAVLLRKEREGRETVRHLQFYHDSWASWILGVNCPSASFWSEDMIVAFEALMIRASIILLSPNNEICFQTGMAVKPSSGRGMPTVPLQEVWGAQPP